MRCRMLASDRQKKIRGTSEMTLAPTEDDSLREFDYDRNSLIGKLDKGLDDAKQNNWVVVDMKNDWKVVYKQE